MAIYHPREIRLTSGETVSLRNCAADDAEPFAKFLQLIASETTHTLQYPGKPISVDATRERWKKAETDPGSIYLGAFVRSDFVGHILFHRENNNHPWLRDNAQFAMFVLKRFWGTGLSSHLMQTALDVLKSWEIKRLAATVRCENERGIAFYKKFGFEIEGTRKDCLRIDGKAASEYYIARLF